MNLRLVLLSYSAIFLVAIALYFSGTPKNMTSFHHFNDSLHFVTRTGDHDWPWQNRGKHDDAALGENITSNFISIMCQC
jgi:hypothetical protein